jgi:hypothetical protein
MLVRLSHLSLHALPGLAYLATFVGLRFTGHDPVTAFALAAMITLALSVLTAGAFMALYRPLAYEAAGLCLSSAMVVIMVVAASAAVSAVSFGPADAVTVAVSGIGIAAGVTLSVVLGRVVSLLTEFPMRRVMIAFASQALLCTCVVMTLA